MFSIVIPVYNEEKNIVILLEEIFFCLDSYKNYEIIIVNDSSTDNTLESIKKNIKNQNLKVINNTKNVGQSYSIYNGIRNSSNDIIITIDGDGQNDPSDISKLLKNYTENKELKLVGGLRLKRKDNLVKVISSKLANYIRKKILKDNCSDTGCSLKVFDKKIFLDFPMFDGIHRFLPALFSGYGYKTLYLPVNHRPRNYGISKYGTMNRLFKGIRDTIYVYKILTKKLNK